MVTLKYKNNIFHRKVFSFAIIFLYIFQVAYLFLNTNIIFFDLLEFLKFFGPISLLLMFTLLSRNSQQVFVDFMVFVLYTHITIALIFLVFNFFSSITSDNRLVISILGRSPGATAQIFCVGLVVYDYYLKGNILILDQNFIIIKILFITIILLTQATSYYLFLIIYFLMNHWFFFCNQLKSYWSYIIVISIGAIIYFSGIADVIFERSLGDSLTTGRNYIWAAFFDDFFSRSVSVVLFGSDLSRHEITMDEISYLTSDVHNTFLDILNYYGLVPLTIFSFWYSFSSRFYRSKKALIILVSYFPILMLSAVFKYPFAFYSSLLILLLPIYFGNVMYSTKNPYNSKNLVVTS